MRRSRFVVAALLAGAVVLGSSSVGAAAVSDPKPVDPEQFRKIMAPSSRPGDRFGWSVDVDGRTYAFGAPTDDCGARDNPTTRNTGVVYVSDSGRWHSLFGGNGTQAGDYFGWSVALAGDRMAVGAPGYDYTEDDIPETVDRDHLKEVGRVYMFKRDAWGAWQREPVPIDMGKPEWWHRGDAFGMTLDMSEDLLVVGAPLSNGPVDQKQPNVDTGSTADSGLVFVYERDGDEWKMRGEKGVLSAAPRFRGNDIDEPAEMLETEYRGDLRSRLDANGYPAVSVSDALNALPEYRDDDTAWMRLWRHVVKDAYMAASDADAKTHTNVTHAQAARGIPSEDTRFGAAVAVEGTRTIAVGAPGEESGGSWGWHDALREPIALPAPCFDLDDHPIARVPWWNPDRPEAGSAYVFEADGSGGWVRQRLTADDAEEGAHFGQSVALSGGTLYVGAPDKNNGKGAVYVFERGADGKWVEKRRIANPDPHEADCFGMSVAAPSNVETMVAVAAPGDGRTKNPDTQEDWGATWVFVRASSTDTWDSATVTSTVVRASDKTAGDVSWPTIGGAEVRGAMPSTIEPWSDPDAQSKWLGHMTGGLAVSDEAIVTGRPSHDAGEFIGNNYGAAWVYRHFPYVPVPCDPRMGAIPSSSKEMTSAVGLGGFKFEKRVFGDEPRFKYSGNLFKAGGGDYPGVPGFESELEFEIGTQDLGIPKEVANERLLSLGYDLGIEDPNPRLDLVYDPRIDLKADYSFDAQILYPEPDTFLADSEVYVDVITDSAAASFKTSDPNIAADLKLGGEMDLDMWLDVAGLELWVPDLDLPSIDADAVYEARPCSETVEQGEPELSIDVSGGTDRLLVKGAREGTILEWDVEITHILAKKAAAYYRAKAKKTGNPDDAKKAAILGAYPEYRSVKAEAWIEDWLQVGADWTLADMWTKGEVKAQQDATLTAGLALTWRASRPVTWISMPSGPRGESVGVPSAHSITQAAAETRTVGFVLGSDAEPLYVTPSIELTGCTVVVGNRVWVEDWFFDTRFMDFPDDGTYLRVRVPEVYSHTWTLGQVRDYHPIWRMHYFDPPWLGYHLPFRESGDYQIPEAPGSPAELKDAVTGLVGNGLPNSADDLKALVPPGSFDVTSSQRVVQIPVEDLKLRDGITFWELPTIVLDPQAAPVPSVADAYALWEGETLVLEASDTYDPDGDPVNWWWLYDYDQSGDPTKTSAWVDRNKAEVTTDSLGPGEHRLGFLVQDDWQWVFVPITVSVEDRPPLARVRFKVEDAGTKKCSLTVRRDGAHDAGDWNVRIEWGDGNVTNGSVPEASSEGTFTHTYGSGDACTAEVTVEAGSNPATIELSVDPDRDSNNKLPVLAGNNRKRLTFTEGSVCATSLAQFAEDEDGDLVGFVPWAGQAQGGGRVALERSGDITFTPPFGMRPGDEAVVEVEFTDYRAIAGEIATITFAMTERDDPPVARNDHYAVDEDTPLTVKATADDSILSNDTDEDTATLSVSLETTPGHGTLEFEPSGRFTYVPDPDFFGQDFFSYRLTDEASQSALAVVCIDVIGQPDKPVGGPDEYLVLEDEVLEMSVTEGLLANDVDADREELFVITDATPTLSPNKGTLTRFEASGAFTYRPSATPPAPGTTEAVSFQYKVTDGTTSRTVPVTIVIEGVNDAPVAAAHGVSVSEDASLVVTFEQLRAGATDEEGHEITATIDSLREGPYSGDTTPTGDGGGFEYVPSADFTGQDSIRFVIVDSLGATSTPVTLTIDVTPVNDAPRPENDTYYVRAEDGGVPFLSRVSSEGVLLNDKDPEGDGLRVELVQDVSRGSLSLHEDGSFEYTPASSDVVSDTFVYRAVEETSAGASAIATATIRILHRPRAVIADVGGVYSDPVTLTVAAADLDGNALELTQTVLPDFASLQATSQVSLGDGSSAADWRFGGNVTLPAGGYSMSATATDEWFALNGWFRDSATGTLTVACETAFFDVPRTAASISSEPVPVDLVAHLGEDDPWPGDPTLANVHSTLMPLGPGDPVVAPMTNPAADGATALSFATVPPNAYEVSVTAGGDYYEGSGTGAVCVQDTFTGHASADALAWTPGGFGFMSISLDKQLGSTYPTDGALGLSWPMSGGTASFASSELTVTVWRTPEELGGYAWGIADGVGAVTLPGGGIVAGCTARLYAEDLSAVGGPRDRFWVEVLAPGGERLLGGGEGRPHEDANGIFVGDISFDALMSGDVDVQRVSGTTRFATAAAVSQAAFPDGADTVVIASGAKWADALAAAGLAGACDGPVLTVGGDSVPQVVADEIARLGATHAYVVGGEASVSRGVLASLTDPAGAALEVTRVAGPSRYDTAERVAREIAALRGAEWDGTVFLATGANYPDAVAASPLAFSGQWPILLTSSASLPTAVDTCLGDLSVSRVVVLGGEGAVSAAIETALKADYGDGSVVRLSGPTRYATAARVADWGVGEAGLGWDGIGIASGVSYADALCGGVLLGRSGSVMLLNPRDVVDPAVRDTLTAHAFEIDSCTIVGGAGAISPAVVEEIDALVQ